ncbi:MAG: hypothetical protein M5U12_18290 [Verrucomicrobia bacterium]|nr:hypothetical protein [Verrucomicrobiota bacterium]
MFLNGTEVTTTKTRAGNVTTATHRPAIDLPPGDHELKVTFAADGQNYEGMTTFTVRNVPTVPPSLALPAAVVNTANTGFLIKTVQNANYQDLGTRGNDTYAGEVQINGLLGLPNTADPLPSPAPGAITSMTTSSTSSARETTATSMPVAGIPTFPFRASPASAPSAARPSRLPPTSRITARTAIRRKS